MSKPIKVVPEEQRQPNPLLDSTWHRVDEFDPKGPQLHADETVLHGSKPGRIDPADPQEDVGAGDEGDGEWVYEEDEVYVTLDLGEAGALHEPMQECAITGLETKTPYLAYGRSLFKGEWDSLIGSEILLHQQRHPEGFVLTPLAPSSSKSKELCETSTTSYRIVMVPMKRQQDELPTKAVHLGGFKHFPGLAEEVARSKKSKKTASERTYEEQWLHKVHLALKRREKLARSGELDPVKSTRRGTGKGKGKAEDQDKRSSDEQDELEDSDSE